MQLGKSGDTALVARSNKRQSFVSSDGKNKMGDAFARALLRVKRAIEGGRSANDFKVVLFTVNVEGPEGLVGGARLLARGAECVLGATLWPWSCLVNDLEDFFTFNTLSTEAASAMGAWRGGDSPVQALAGPGSTLPRAAAPCGTP